MLHDGIQTKRYSKFAELLATPEAWLLAASIAWCAILGCGLIYVIMNSTL